MATAQRPRAAVPPRKPAPPKRPVAARPASRRRSRTPIVGNLVYMVGLIALLLTVLPTALILVIGGLPTLVAVVIDRHPRHFLTRCVGFLNFAGISPYLVKIWHHHTVLAAMQMLTNPYAWLVMYGAAGVGWIIYLSAPSIAWLQVELMGTRRIKALQTRQHQLVEEWGEEVAQAVGVPDGAPPSSGP